MSNVAGSTRGRSGLAGERIEFAGQQLTITDVLVRVQMRDGAVSTTLVRPNRPWMEIAAAPGLLAVAGAYVLHGNRAHPFRL